MVRSRSYRLWSMRMRAVTRVLEGFERSLIITIQIGLPRYLKKLIAFDRYWCICYTYISSLKNKKNEKTKFFYSTSPGDRISDDFMGAIVPNEIKHSAPPRAFLFYLKFSSL